MKVQGNTIYFKSDPKNFENEISGAKRNTVRMITNQEVEDNLGKFGHISITNTVTNVEFQRVISDITQMDVNGAKVFIFSWW